MNIYTAESSRSQRHYGYLFFKWICSTCNLKWMMRVGNEIKINCNWKNLLDFFFSWISNKELIYHKLSAIYFRKIGVVYGYFRFRVFVFHWLIIISYILCITWKLKNILIYIFFFFQIWHLDIYFYFLNDPNFVYF